jgi:polyprenyl-phospho-N-acetylgalactosaminyl synthase
MNKNTYVIMPVYNEESVVKEVIEQLESYFSNIVCIDDGSTDHSVKEISKTSAVLLQHDNNKGQGAALRTGIQHVLRDKGAQYFITFDADGQHDPADATKMLQSLKKHNMDIILGSRFLGTAENMSFIKGLVLKLAVAFTNKTTGVHLTDTHNGLRVFNRNFAEKLQLRCNGMAHASEFIYRISEGYFHYDEAPVTIRYTNYSKSKGQSIWNGLHILRELRTSRKKLSEQT